VWRVGDEGGEKVRVGREEKGSGLFFGIVPKSTPFLL